MDGFADVVERISRQKAGTTADEEQAAFVGEDSDLVHVSVRYGLSLMRLSEAWILSCLLACSWQLEMDWMLSSRLLLPSKLREYYP